MINFINGFLAGVITIVVALILLARSMEGQKR